MNKKIKSLVMAGLVTIMAGSTVVSSSALCKNNMTITNKKGVTYIFVNGKKHLINLGGINKPSQDNNSSNGGDNQNNNTNIGRLIASLVANNGNRCISSVTSNACLLISVRICSLLLFLK